MLAPDGENRKKWGNSGSCKEQSFLSCRIDVLKKKGRRKEKKKPDEVREKQQEALYAGLSRPWENFGFREVAKHYQRVLRKKKKSHDLTSLLKL